MKMSRRAKRMDRHHKRNKGLAALNLVSLMDIFTILVFFLLVNSGEVQVLPNAKALKLPESIAEKKPHETLVLMVNQEEILLRGQRVVDLHAPLADAVIIQPLADALKQQADIAKTNTLVPFKGEITIMGDKEIPYTLLKRTMATCALSDYPKISLAVQQRQGEAPAPEQTL